MSESQRDARVGTRLGPYELTAILGQGGMGTVFQGEDTFTGRQVAVKLLHATFARDEGVAQRFIREARAAVSLRHPNVVEVLHMNQDDEGVVYMVLELLEGRSLDARLRKEGRLRLGEALEYLLPIMSALEVAHDKNIVHRDVKPENIFLAETANGVVPKLLDFGIAKMADAATGFSTNAGAIMGSPAYMSPEQAMGSNKIGPATDVWAMGVVIYECLSGASPFAAGDAQKCLSRVLTLEPPSLAEVVEGLPEGVLQLVERALRKEQQARPSMEQLRSAFAAGVVDASPSYEVAATRISGVDDPTDSEAQSGGFPESPSIVGLAPTNPSVASSGGSLPSDEAASKSESSKVSADEDTVVQVTPNDDDGTFMPASSDSSLPGGRKFGVVLAIALSAVAAAVFLVVKGADSGKSSTPSGESTTPSEEPAMAPSAAGAFVSDRDAKPVADQAVADPNDRADEEVRGSEAPASTEPAPRKAPHSSKGTPAPSSVKTASPAKTAHPPSPNPSVKPQKGTATPPSPEEVLKKKREERIEKIPSISEL